MRKLIFIFLALATVSFASWSRPIARDSEPGYVYFFGPNFDPADSTDDWYLYFSEDTGKTYSVIKEYDSEGACYGDNISTDVRSGVLFLTNVSVCTYISYDFGASFEDTIPDVGLIGGGIEGECGDGYYWSPDYGETMTTGEIIGFPTRHYNHDRCPGYLSGMFFFTVDLPSDDDLIIMTTDTNDTYMPVIPFPFVSSQIRLGAANREMFIYKNDSIYYSFDGCSTFTVNSDIDRSLFYYFPKFVRGWQSREIITRDCHIYMDFITGDIGGWVSIHFSTDCGQTWREIVKHDMLAIEETPNYEEHDELEIIQTSCSLSANKPFVLYNIQGKKVGNGLKININNLSNGIYIAKSEKTSRKIFVIK